MQGGRYKTNDIACQLCGFKDIWLLYKVDEFKIMKCPRCNLVFTDVSNLDIVRLYSRNYFEDFQIRFFSSCHENYDSCEKDPRLANFEQNLKLISMYKATGRILDIGCATGVFLDMARKKGWEPYGVDISEYAAHYARDKFGIKVETKELYEIKFPDKFFDVITMWDTIEHLPNPRQTLEESFRILKDDGLLAILTVDEDSLIPRLAHLIYKCSFGKLSKPVKLVHPIHHITHFSRQTLTHMLKLAGFEIRHLSKNEIPLQSLRWGWRTKIIIGMMYALAKLFNMQYEVKVLAAKNMKR